MPAPIGPIQPPSFAELAVPVSDRQQPGQFSAVLDKAISEVEQSRKMATEKADRLLSGQPEELHSVVLNVQRAQLEFELFLEVRNKVVQAYQEIMRMQV
jgi:flagellar hook-basal body complex protein FliE